MKSFPQNARWRRRAASEGEEQAFGQHLTNDSRATCTERETQRHLVAPRRRAHQQQIREVDGSMSSTAATTATTGARSAARRRADRRALARRAARAAAACRHPCAEGSRARRPPRPALAHSVLKCREQVGARLLAMAPGFSRPIISVHHSQDRPSRSLSPVAGGRMAIGSVISVVSLIRVRRSLPVLRQRS